MSSADDATVRITRWMARLMSVGLAAVLAYLGLVALFQAHGQSPLEQLLTVWGMMTFDLWAVAVGGLLLAFVWEGAGGAIAASSALILYTYGLWQRPERFDALALLCALTGLAYLFCWWRVRRSTRGTRQKGRRPAPRSLWPGNTASQPKTRGPSRALLPDSAMQREPILTAHRHLKRARSLPFWLQPGRRHVDLDAVRESLESGPGGDLDADGRLARRGASYVPGLKGTVSAWVALHERVQRGELGGAGDGQTPFNEAGHVV